MTRGESVGCGPPVAPGAAFHVAREALISPMYNQGMATQRSLGLVASGLVAAFGWGCKSTSSVDLATDGISADIRVSATWEIASKVRVQMSPGNVVVVTDTVKLEGGDVLYAEAGTQRKQMGYGNLDYEALFVAGAAETPFRVSFDRAKPDQVDAPDSTGTLPLPFNLRDLGGAQISQEQNVVLTWSPSGTSDLMMLDIQGSCVEESDALHRRRSGQLHSGRRGARAGDDSIGLSGHAHPAPNAHRHRRPEPERRKQIPARAGPPNDVQLAPLSAAKPKRSRP